MKAVSFNFEIHQPMRLKRYRFFDIGNDHYYYDDFLNDDIVTRLAERSYIPAAKTLLKMIEDTKGKFRCSIAISGVAIEQFEQYVPEMIDLLKKLADTGKCEFVAMPYAYSLASLTDPEEFAEQVRLHSNKLNTLIGVDPKVLRNTELIYCDEIAPQILAMGYKGVISVLSNVCPAETAQMASLTLNGNVAEAAQMQLKYLPFINALFCETSPIPVKAAMAKIGMCDEELRLPLIPMQDATRQKMFAIMAELGLIA